MVSLAGFTRCFILRWQISLLITVLLFFLVRLGFWQLSRAEEKNHMLAGNNLASLTPFIPWRPNDQAPTQYQRVQVTGHFLPTTFFLDNQHYRHRLGYHVLSPLELSDQRIILIDRGWVIKEPYATTLPSIANASGERSIQGSVYFPSRKDWSLGPVLEKKSTDVALVELIDTQLMSQFLHKSVYPFIIRLDREEPDGFIREWAIVAMSPARHYGYALQWFALAVVLLTAWITFNLKHPK